MKYAKAATTPGAAAGAHAASRRPGALAMGLQDGQPCVDPVDNVTANSILPMVQCLSKNGGAVHGVTAHRSKTQKLQKLALGLQ